MRDLLLLFILSTFTLSTVKATTITCNNSNYAGKKLNFFQYSDPITLDKELVFSLEFDDLGRCEQRLDNKTTIFTFCEFGIYKGLLFIEPKQNINLSLPKPREKSFAEEKNPYFSPISFWIATENKNQLNDHILAYTQQFNFITDKFFNEIYFRRSRIKYDSAAHFLNKKFLNINSPTFLSHKNLKLKMVEIEAFREKPENYSKLFSSIKSDFWLHPAFISLFEKTFSQQLSFLAKAIDGGEIAAAVNNGNLIFLLQHTKTKYQLNGKIVELALLKMLHDGFYSGDFSKNAIKEMVKDKLFTNNVNPIIKLAALQISSKFTFLQKGTSSPVICLNDLNWKQVCTDKTKDKFKYLIFADTEMIVTREHLKYLEKIHQRFQKNLEIFVVLRNTDMSEVNKFIDANNVPGIKLMDIDNKYINTYKIRSFPQCFLLDEEHKIVFANTKAPLDGFEQQFGPFLQHILFERQRNQGR